MAEMKNEMVFMMGAPGSGKSYIASKYFKSTHKFIDADEYKQEHPKYDPENSSLVHNYSLMRLEQEFRKALINHKDYLIDGTGTDKELMFRRFNEAHKHGYKTTLVYVKVSLKTCMCRNKNRTRKVPEEVIKTKFTMVKKNYRLYISKVDNTRPIIND